MDERSVFDDKRYPCSDCPTNEICSHGCSWWIDWVFAVWKEVCKPFREIKARRDERNDQI